MQAIESAMPSTKSELILRGRQAQQALAGPLATPKQAAEQGKRLLGSYPHAKPSDPEGYALAITAVLQQYPLAVVQECCDPRYGLARTREFTPTVACIVEWCDLKIKRLQGAVIWSKKLEGEKEFSDAHRKSMLDRLKNLWKTLPMPVTQ
jgi:hypothetical protein